MDYRKHYDRLVDRARNRLLEGYSEKHHVVPRCLGGTDEKENLVTLTPEEHYVAHQLLVKMHPDNQGLAWAALAMTGHHTNFRKNNKSYGWLRRRHSLLMKTRTGEKNGSFGKKWYHDPVSMVNVKCANPPPGYVKGRFYEKTFNGVCLLCENERLTKRSSYCEEHYSHRAGDVRTKISQSLKNTMYITDGNIDKRIKSTEPIPDNFWKGRSKGLRKPS